MFHRSRMTGLLASGLFALAVLALSETTAGGNAATPGTPAAQTSNTKVAGGVLESGQARVGKAAPDFTLKGDDEKAYTLRNLRGKWVVLAFYPADFTRG